jgi:hypothetical protein
LEYVAMSAIARNHSFVSDGHEIACAAIRAEVKREFAERWKNATWWKRWHLWAEINAEMRRRAARLAPPGALY